MDRSDLQELSKMRLKEAKLLLDASCFEGAYYLAGYAVECALKACIAKQVQRYEFPDKRLATKCHSHDVKELLNLAGLKADMDKEEAAGSAVWVNWRIVTDWSEQARYEGIISANLAKDLYSAIATTRNGVLRWLKNRW